MDKTDPSITTGSGIDSKSSRDQYNGQWRATLKKIRHDSEYRVRCLHTVFVMWLFITLGIVVSMVGGVFPDLRLIINKDLETASWIFTAGAIGYMIGALSAGFLFDRVNRLLVLAAASVFHAICFSLYPWFSSFPVMLAISASSSLFSGSIDCCGNAHIGSIWGSESAPFMQCVHFGFSFGGFIGPLIAEPFVAPKDCIFKNSTIETTTMANASIECEEVYGETHITYAFLIAGIIALSAAIPFLVMYCLPSRYNLYVCTPYEQGTNQVQENEEKTMPKMSRFNKTVFVILLALLISDYACIEARFSSLLTTFLNDYLGWLTSTGLHVTSLFWGMFAAGRLLGIVVTRFLSSESMIITYLIALALTFVAFLFGAMYNLDKLIWASSALAGLCMSVIFPSVFSWTAEKIVVSGAISSFYIIGCSGFNMLLPLLFGYLMDNITQMYYIYLLLASVGLAICLFACSRCFIKMITKN
ncbi:hypothetical protein ACF0H5_018002 [Mactra antiquata]